MNRLVQEPVPTDATLIGAGRYSAIISRSGGLGSGSVNLNSLSAAPQLGVGPTLATLSRPQPERRDLTSDASLVPDPVEVGSMLSAAKYRSSLTLADTDLSRRVEGALWPRTDRSLIRKSYHNPLEMPR